MHRREFVFDGIKASIAFLALDAFRPRAWGQRNAGADGWPIGDVTEIDAVPADLDDSLNIVAAYLTQYAPPDGTVPAGGAWKATFDLVDWDGSIVSNPNMTFIFPLKKHAFRRFNRVAGGFTLLRRPGGREIEYEIDLVLRTFGDAVGGRWNSSLHFPNEPRGFDSVIRSRMRCSDERLPRLLRWNLAYENHRLESPWLSSGLTESGSQANGSLEIRSSAGIRRWKTDRPVVPQWALMDALSRAAAGGAASACGVEFDLLHDLTSYRPRQVVRPYGDLTISLGGTTHALRGFVQIGTGTQPTHYWIDAAGRPLICTTGLRSTVLTSIAEA